MRKTISLVLAVLMMLVLLPAVKFNSAVAEDATPEVIMDFTTNGWGLPTSYVKTAATYSNGTYTIAFGESSNGHKFGGNYLIFGKKDATLSLPAFDFDVEKIVVTGNSNASAATLMNVYVGNTAVSTQTTGCQETNTYAIDADYRAAGNVYTFKVDSAHNAQMTKIEIYKVSGSSEPDPTASSDPTVTPDPTAAPVTTAMELVTELKAGDEVVIYYPDSSKVVTGEDYLFNNTKHELVAADAVLAEDVLAVPEAALRLTVEVTTNAEEPDTAIYSFKAADGKYLFADGTDLMLVERTEANAEDTLFQLESTDGGFFIRCNTATYNDNGTLKPQYIEYYKGYFTVFSMGTAKYYTFQFYAEPGDEPPTSEGPDTVILFTNDVHCGIEDGWGYAGVAKVKKDLEAEGNKVLLVDAGDHIQGGPIGTLSNGEYIIDIMNKVGYDLAIPGNHEFDYGMTQFLNNIVTKANYPYISANFMNYADGAATTPVFDAYKIFESNGKKIAFVGLSTPETITKSTPTYFMNEAGEYIYGFCQDKTGEGVYTTAQNAIDAAKAAGADYVIVIGHMGIDEQSQPWTAPEVIAHVTGLDALIDGHSHSVINGVKVADKDGKEVLHGQTGTKLANLGKLTIKADGTITMEIIPAPATVEKDAETDAYIQEIKAQYEALLNEVVAYTDHLLTTVDPATINDPKQTRWVRNRETNLGDLCADAYRTLLDADIAFVNGGGVRANIKAGDITYGDILNVHPFGNMACLVEVTGQQILDALEMGARMCPGENGGFLQVAGLKYEIHTYLDANVSIGDDGMWKGNAGLSKYRVQNVQVMNKETGEYAPLDLEKTYQLASHNYMLKSQGDGFAMFGTKNVTILRDEVMVDNQVLINYIQSMPTNEDGKHVVTGYTNPEAKAVLPSCPSRLPRSTARTFRPLRSVNLSTAKSSIATTSRSRTFRQLMKLSACRRLSNLMTKCCSLSKRSPPSRVRPASTRQATSSCSHGRPTARVSLWMTIPSLSVCTSNSQRPFRTVL